MAVMYSLLIIGDRFW